ncbi:hypothetical protein [Paludisphaera rhizosphaerae]|uniref:hypothetical protein n=1 Tax=Paludisphaera rhizosphaerae TaxID=2711216 RepID=UPI0013EC2CE4|nr:hypothetical protein [Paludisphaera rhizosphaerae]
MSFFGNTTQVDKLVMQVEGQSALREANALLERQKKAVQDVIEFHKMGWTSSQQYAQQIRQEVAALKAMQGQVDALNRSFGGGTSAAAKAQGVNQLAYAVQDFTSVSGGLAQKMNSVTNNLQVFAASMGVGGVWFLAISAAMGAIQAVANNWNEIESWLTGMPSIDPKKIAEQAKELAKKQKEMADAIQAIRDEEDQADDSTKVAERVKQASIAVGGFDRVRNSVAAQMAGQSPEIRAADEAVRRAQAEQAAAQKALAGSAPGAESRIDLEARLGGANSALKRAQDAATAARQGVDGRALELIQKARAGDPAAARELASRFPNSPFAFATPEQVATDEARAAKTKEVNKLVDEYARDNEGVDASIERGRNRKNAEVKRLEEAYAAGNDAIDAADARPAARVRVGQPARGAAVAAVQDMRADQQAMFAQVINQETGGQFGADAVAQAAEQMAGMVNRGVAPMEAAAAAMQNLVQVQAAANQRMFQLQSMFAGMGQQAAMMQQQMMQQPAMGGFSGMPRQW